MLLWNPFLKVIQTYLRSVCGALLAEPCTISRGGGYMSDRETASSGLNRSQFWLCQTHFDHCSVIKIFLFNHNFGLYFSLGWLFFLNSFLVIFLLQFELAKGSLMQALSLLNVSKCYQVLGKCSLTVLGMPSAYALHIHTSYQPLLSRTSHQEGPHEFTTVSKRMT